MAVGFLLTFIALGVLMVLVVDVFVDALPRLNVKFITSYPSRFPEHAGVLPALVGSIWIGILTGLISFPIGVLTAVYLEEYAPKNIITCNKHSQFGWCPFNNLWSPWFGDFC